MNSQATKILLAFIFSFSGTVVLAEGDGYNPPAPEIVPEAPKSTVVTTPSSGNSVNQSANDNKNDNKKASAMSFLNGAIHITMGTMNISAGTAPCSEGSCGQLLMGVMQVALGMLSLDQGGESGKKSGSSGLTANQSAGSGYDYASNDVLPLLEKEDPRVGALKGNLEKLKDLGVDVNAGTAKVGDKTYKLSDLTSKAGMMAAGLPSEAWDGAMAFSAKSAKAAQDKVEKLGIGSRTAATGFEEGGGGAGMGVASGDIMYGDGSAGYAGGGGSGLGSSFNRDPSSLAGMQKNYNGDPIGVAADSIFLMMSRRYKVKEGQESFYTDADLALKK